MKKADVLFQELLKHAEFLSIDDSWRKVAQRDFRAWKIRNGLESGKKPERKLSSEEFYERYRISKAEAFALECLLRLHVNTIKELAAEMKLQEQTVKNYITVLLKRTKTRTKAALVKLYYQSVAV